MEQQTKKALPFTDFDLGHLGDGMKNGLNQFRELTRQKPYVVLGAAFGIGLIAGLLASKKKNPDANQK